MVSGILFACVFQSLAFAGALLATGTNAIANRFLAMTLAVLAGMLTV